jgi:hypothetical protein
MDRPQAEIPGGDAAFGRSRRVIDGMDREIREWASAALGGARVTHAPPGTDAGAAVSLYLLEMRPAPAARGAERPPQQIALRYLVTAVAAEPEEAHRVLGELVFAAMDRPGVDVILEPPPPEVWAAFGVPPQPSFLLEVPLRRARPEREVQRVTGPLVVRVRREG